MFSNPDLVKFIFGRLTLEAIPYHEPILVVTFLAVAVGGLALLAEIGGRHGEARRCNDDGRTGRRNQFPHSVTPLFGTVQESDPKPSAATSIPRFITQI